MLVGILSFFLGKIGLFTVGGLLIVGTIACFMLLSRRLGMIMAIVTACYFGAGIVYNEIADTYYERGVLAERGIWQKLADAEKARQAEALAESEALRKQLATAREGWSREAQKRLEADIRDIEQEAAQEEESAKQVNPATPRCRCTDSDRDVDRLQRRLRGKT